MSFAEALAAQTVVPGPKCWYQATWQALEPDDRASLDQALADTNIAHTAISRALKANGVHVNKGGVARHRQGECRCP